MDTDDADSWLRQPVLFKLENEKTGSVELFPAVWTAAEGLVSSNVMIRRKAVAYLEESGAARYSPLVAYLLATRLSEPDDEIRICLIKILADLLGVDPAGNVANEAVRQTVISFLAEMRTRQLYSLLLTLQKNPTSTDIVERLLNAAPFAGLHLADIASSRKFPIEIRRIALSLIGSVGYLDALPTLERMLQRLESRMTGQQSLPFAIPGNGEDLSLFSDLKTTIQLLNTR